MRLDPYLVWRILTGSFGIRPAESGGDAYYSVVIQLRRPFEPIFGLDLDEMNEHIAPSHTHCMGVGRRRPYIMPALVTPEGLIGLIVQALGAGADSANVERWELCLPLASSSVPPPVLAGHPTDVLGGAAATLGPHRNTPSFKEVAGWFSRMLVAGRRRANGEQGSSGLTPRQNSPEVCIIDDRCNFASAPLRSGNELAVDQVFVLGGEQDQLARMDRTKRYRAPLEIIGWPIGAFEVKGCLQGRRLHTLQFAPDQPTRANGLVSNADDEPGIYRSSAYLHPTPSASHGAAVLGLIASKELRIGTKSFKRPHPKKVRFAQVPLETVLDTSGASLAAHVLDAIHDALDDTPADTDLVVNLSFGTHGGGHDGTSLIESALLELLEIYNGHSDVEGKRLIVVLPAGNSHRVRCHARGCASNSRSGIIDWKVQPDDDAASFIEIWLPKNTAFEAKIEAPGGLLLQHLKVTADQLGAYLPLTREGQTIGAAVFSANPPQSQTQSLLLIGISGDPERHTGPGSLGTDILTAVLRAFSVAATPTPQSRSDAPRRQGKPVAHGIWRISLQPGSGGKQVEWNAYVQRGDQAPHRRRASLGVTGRQSYIVDSGESAATPEFTMNGIATFRHDRLFVAGALNRNDGSLTDYTSAGPATIGCDRIHGPDVVVAADESRRLRGLLVNGVLSGSHRRESGTSMAAAALTRHLWEHLNAGGLIESFCGPAPLSDSVPYPRPAGSPAQAHPLLRGETRRVVSTREDGSLLGEPCTAPRHPVQACGVVQSTPPNRR